MSNALIIVDVQNDFVENGSLGVEGGTSLAERLATHVRNGSFDSFDHFVTTQDWHIDPGTHFSETPDYVDTWPVHCVARTEGAKIVAPLIEALIESGDKGKGVSIAVKKGMMEAAYSGFEGVSEDGLTLAESLRTLGVTDVTIVGIATDHCVRATALDAIKEGFNTTVWTDYCVGIDDDRCNNTLNKELPENNVTIL